MLSYANSTDSTSTLKCEQKKIHATRSYLSLQHSSAILFQICVFFLPGLLIDQESFIIRQKGRRQDFIQEIN